MDSLEKEALLCLAHKIDTSAEIITRARIALHTAEQLKPAESAARLGITLKKVERWRAAFAEQGLLGLQQTTGSAKITQRARPADIILKATETPPKKHRNWTTRLIAQELATVSHDTVARVFKAFDIYSGSKHQRHTLPKRSEKKPQASAPKNATLKDLAQAANVSTATASKALRGRSGVSPSTIAHVQKVARQLNYKGNAYAATLAKQRNTTAKPVYRATIACLLGYQDHNPALTPLRNPGVLEMIAGIKKNAGSQGFTVEVHWVHDPEISPARLDETLKSRGITGLILVQMHASEIDFPWEDYSCAYASPWLGGGPLKFPSVNFNNFENTYYSYQNLHHLGYRNIGYIDFTDPKIGGSYYERYGAYIAAQKKWGGTTTPLAVQKSISSAKVKQWFRENKPDCLILTDESTIKLLKRTTIPQLHSCLQCFSSLHQKEPEQTGMLVPYSQIGAKALDLLIDQIHRQTTGPSDNAIMILLQSSWQHSESASGVE